MDQLTMSPILAAKMAGTVTQLSILKPSVLTLSAARRKDDEIHDHIRECHSDHDIPSRSPKIVIAGALSIGQPGFSLCDFLFDLDVGLPGVEIGR